MSTDFHFPGDPGEGEQRPVMTSKPRRDSGKSKGSDSQTIDFPNSLAWE